MKLLLAALMILAMVGVASADTIALKAAWIPNTDSVTTGYKLYRTDGTRTLLGTIPGKTTSTYLFSITVPTGASGTASFVMTAYSATKESADSVTVNFPFDLSPAPLTPAGFSVISQ